MRFSHHPSTSIKEVKTKDGSRPPMTTPVSQDHRQHFSQALHTETKSQSRHQQTTSSRHTAQYDETRSGKQALSNVQSSLKTRHGDTANEAAQSRSLSQRDNQSMASLGSERNPLRPQLRADTLRSHPTWSVKQNPFLIADREAKSKVTAEPPLADNNERTKQPRNGLEGAARHGISTGDSRDEDEGCDNPACRATHEGHRPFRHSVSCALYRSSQDEDVYMSPRGVDELSRKIRDSTPKSKLAERPSPVIEALHSRHDTIHRHHSPGFHGPEHIAEHLALVLDRNRHDSHADPTGESTRQAAEEEAAKSPEVAKEAADHHHATQQLEPLTQVQATTKVDSFRYREEPLQHGHPSHKDHHHSSNSIQPTPGNDTSKVTEPGHEANEARQTLRYVHRTDSMRDAVGREHLSPIYDRNVTRGTPSRSPLRIVKRKQSAMFGGQGTATKEEGPQGGEAQNHPARVTKKQEKTISHTDDSQSQTTNMERDTKHTERTRPKEVQYPSKTEATSHGKTPITAIDARSDDSDRQSHVSDERILFNGQKRIPAPKGRLSSPPPWLKTPSKKPATVQDRLRHVDTRSHYGLSRSGREQSKKIDRPSSSARSHDPSKATLSQPSSPRVDLQSRSKDFQKTVRTQNEPETWLGLPSELQQHRVTDKSVVAQEKASNFQERVSTPQKQTSMSHHGHESEYSDGCIFCEAPSPTPPHVRELHGRNAVEAPPGPSKVSSPSHVLGEPSHPAGSAQDSYRRATLRAQEQLDQLRAMTCYSSNQQRTTQTWITASGLTSTPLQRRQVSFQDNVEEEIPQVSEREDASSSGDGYDDAFSFSSEASNLEIHRPTPIAPPNHDCRWKDRYMALTSEIRQLKAEMSTRVSFHDADVGSAQEHGAQLQQQDEDLGIQGLTIVMHLKGKDDLVINTDLTQEAEEVEE